MKKSWMLLGISVLSLAVLTGCTSTADTLPSPSPSAAATPSNTPETTMGPTVSIAPALTAGPDMGADTGVGAGMDTGMDTGMGMDAMAGVNSLEDAKRVSDQVSEEVEKLSELDDAEAVVAGNIALVGIEYDDQYQGGMTDRLREMVEERVDMIDKTITTVHVTDDGEMKTRISELRDRMDSANFTFEELQTQVLDIGSSIAGGGEPNVTQPQATTGA